MEEIANFYKVNKEEFKQNFTKNSYTIFCKGKTLWLEKEILEIYEKIDMPIGKKQYYLFKNLREFSLKPNERILVPTGIKVEIFNEDYILNIGKYNIPGKPFVNIKISAWNNIPFIHSDYDQEIKLLVENNDKKIISFKEDEIIAYGIFMKIGKCI